MSLTLHYHPLSSFCQKTLLGLYELAVPFDKQLVDLGNEVERAALMKLWPMGRFPVLHDDERNVTLPESSVILAYVEGHYARGNSLLPRELDRAIDCQARDRFFDLDVNAAMQKIVTDKLRPEGRRDSFGVERARDQLETAYGVADDWLRGGPWATGETFSLADCAAAPALLYANQVLPFMNARRHLAAYFTRLCTRPSFARVREEAKPYWSLFPG